MTDEEVLADLKQFIVATVSQATADMATKADLANMATKADLAGETSSLRRDMNKRFDELSLQVDTIADAHAEHLADHERRLMRLEHRPAA